MFRTIALFCALLAVASCNVTRVVKPLEKGEKQLSASFGGPAILLSGTPMPIPFSSVAYAHGLDSNVTVSAGFHTTSLLFGVVHADVGLSINAFESKSQKFGITISPAVHLLHDIHEQKFRSYPQIDANAWWKYGKKDHLLYGGAGTWIELHRARAHGEEQPHELMPYLTLGHQWVRENWSFQAEVRYIGFPYRNDKLVVNYLTPLNTGTSGVYVGISRNIGKP